MRGSKDWPELQDQIILMREGLVNEDGVPYNEPGEADAAAININNITPSSPLWTPGMNNGRQEEHFSGLPQ